MGGNGIVLLDSHIFVWLNLEPERIPTALRAALDGQESSLAISAISIWEVMLAMERGWIAAHAGPQQTLLTWLQDDVFAVLPVDQEIAILSRTLPFQHEDPADRFIAATAFRFRCSLATVDTRLRALPWLKLLA